LIAATTSAYCPGINPESSERWGEFSQTYPLVGLIDCETKLSATWEDVL
jgi:hypothetical protein